MVTRRRFTRDFKARSWKRQALGGLAQVFSNGERAEFRLEKECREIAATILEGLDEILYVVVPALSLRLCRSLACINTIETMTGTIRQLTRNVKRCQDEALSLRWTAARIMGAKKALRELKGIQAACSTFRCTEGTQTGRYHVGCERLGA